MKQISVVILIGMLIILPSCKYFKGGSLFGKKARTMAIMKAQEDSIKVADSLIKIKDYIKEVEKQKIDSARAAEEKRVAVAIHLYNIIVGSFITPQYAEAMADDYRRKGYDPRILRPDNSKFQYVAAEGHDNFRRAVTRLKQFQDTVQTESWLYVKK
jgi:hypothetical protein